jgi:hypothetical protein
MATAMRIPEPARAVHLHDHPALVPTARISREATRQDALARRSAQ